ncbi:MarR family winged helix-turn-helix transcriptional regulator [Silvimonas iriomotensis]|uniref:MarR family transcriptional regulator n=1 Tax=Silvimonas iriomotensis TaxID=449662 RepID=A0ABQ2PDK2_9NEIS|nr:MarR family transcriptional regulator [Silvimonas iriomotensis]GGP23406.1 MarR family transcriptional regulator [Silvimonas iriomotensis]
MALPVENLLGVLALHVMDELQDLPAPAPLHGLTTRAALNAVHAYPGCSIETLREVLDLCHPAAVRAVAGLVEAGLVRKDPGRDKRTAALNLTEAGKLELHRIMRARDHMLSRVVGRLDAPEQQQLEQLLIKMLWSETRDSPHSMRLCRLCDDGPCLAAGCPVENRATDLPMPLRETTA